ncbi:TetR/AcrR family transcriptional regulator [bacterium]|nr:TetR/AcrR family transcriptional regulator [bacterium]MBQ3367540.1 TetR/AcrR family transcriptional regulator [bacterium]
MKISTEQKKEIILRNFVSLMQQYGIEKVTLNDVAEKSGLTKSALYYYFNSKEALIIATYRYFRDKMNGKCEAMMKKAVNPAEKIKAYCDFSFSVVAKDDEMRALFEFSEDTAREVQKYVTTIPDLIREIKIDRDRELEILCGMISAYSGREKDDPRIVKVAITVSTMISGFLIMLFKIRKEETVSATEGPKMKFSGEILEKTTNEEFSAFIISGIDALIKTTFKDKN